MNYEKLYGSLNFVLVTTLIAEIMLILSFLFLGYYVVAGSVFAALLWFLLVWNALVIALLSLDDEKEGVWIE